jgi:hypothetical protein
MFCIIIVVVVVVVVVVVIVIVIVIVIIIIITIIGKTALFEQQPSLEDYARLHPDFISLDFATIIFFTEQVVSLASDSQPGGPGLCIYVPR